MADPVMKTFKIRDESGASYSVQAPEDATDEEIAAAFDQFIADTPAAPQSPVQPRQTPRATPPQASAPAAPQQAPSPDFGQAFQAGAAGLREDAPNSVALPFQSQERADKGQAFEELQKKTQPGRAALAAYGRAASSVPRSEKEIEDFITQVGDMYFGSSQDPGFRQTARESIEHFRKYPRANTISALGVPKELELSQESDSGLVTAAKEALLNTPGAAAGLAAAGAANKFLPPMHPLARLGLTLGAGFAGGVAGQGAAETGYDLGNEYLEPLGLDRDQRQVNEKENPYWSFGGQIASGLIGGRPTLKGGIPMRAMEAGMGAGIETGSQLVQGEFDPVKIAMAAAGNAAMGGTNRLSRWAGFTDAPPAEAFNYSGVQRGDHVTYDPAKIRAETINNLAVASVDDVIAGSNYRNVPQARETLTAIKERVDAGDYIGATELAQNLDIPANNGMSVDDAVRSINRATESWSNAPKVTVHASPTADTVPPHLGVKEGTLGVFDKDTGEVHVFADQLVNPSDAQAVVFHEALGHAGLAWKYQDELDDLLVNLYRGGNSNFKSAVNRWMAANPNAYDNIQSDHRRLAAQIEEVLAESSENGPLQRKAFDLIKNKVKNIARAAGMDHLEYSDREIRSILATGHDNIVNGGDRSTGLGGVRYIYAGENSQNAPAQNEYERLVSAGAPDEAARRMTGWHTGPDGKRRYEISDQDFDINPAVWDAAAADGAPRKAEEIFNHPKLFEAYPQLRDMEVSVKPDPWDFSGTSQGWQIGNEIVITPYSVDPRGTAIHELQHAVQEIEGFARGGNSDTALKHVSPDVLPVAAERASQFLNQKIESLNVKTQALINAERSEIFSRFIKVNEEKGPAFQEYKILEGEGTVPPEEIQAAHDRWESLFNEDSDLRMQFENEFGQTETDVTQLSEILSFLSKPAAERDIVIDRLSRETSSVTDLADGLAKAAKDGNPDTLRSLLQKVPEVKDQAYRALYGEVEARDTQRRANLGDDARRMLAPNTNEPVQPNEYVFSGAAEQSADAGAPRERVPYTLEDMERISNTSKTRLAEQRTKQARTKERNTNERRIKDWIRGSLDEDQGNLRFAQRQTRNAGYTPRTEEFLDTHLSPKLANELHGWIKNLPEHERVPDEVVIANALDLGVDMDMIRKVGAMEDNSDLVVGIADFMTDKARQVTEQAQRMFTEGGSPKSSAAEEAVFVKQILELGEVMASFNKTRSNLGRMFRSLQTKIGQYGEDFDGITDFLNDFELGNETTLTSDAIREMARRIASGDIKTIRKEIDKFDPDWGKFANSYYYNNLLGTASVQEGNILGNAFKMLQELGTDAAGAAVGSARALTQPAASRVTWKEIGNRWAGLGEYLKTPETWRAVVRELTAPAGTAHKNKWQSQAHQHLPTSLALEGFVRMLQATDVFFRGATEAVVINGLAVRRANQEAQAEFGGKFGAHQSSDWVKNRVAELQQNPTNAMLSEAQQAGVDSVFQTNLGPIAEKLTSIRNIKPVDTMTTLAHIVGRLSMPVVTAPVNIWKGAAELSTIPAIARLKKGNLSPEQQNREVAKLMIGAATTYVAYNMAANAELTGLGPSDPEDRAEWLLSHKPQSIKIGDDWVSYKSLEPVATYMTVMADTIQEIQRGGLKAARKENKGWSQLIGNTMSAFGEAMLSNSFVSGFAENLSDGKNIFEKLILGATTPMTRLPWISEAAVLSDDYKRDMRGTDLFDKVAKRTQNTDPGVFTAGRQALPVKIDGLGRPMKRVIEQETDPTALELGRLFDKTGVVIAGAVSRAPRGVPIPSDIYNAHMMIVGPAVKEQLKGVMERPEYKNWNDEQKAQALKKIATQTRSRYSKLLDQAMVERNPDYQKVMMSEMKRAFAEDGEEDTE